MRLPLAILVLCGAVRLEAADSTYYVDGDWAGTQSGTQAQPWRVINWTTVNTALASGNVTIYLSAREAGSDTDDSYDNGTGTPIGIDFNSRSDTGSNVLTVSGNQFWNTSDSSPSWSAYSGTARCRVKKLDAQNGGLAKRSNITMHGLHVIQTGVDKAVTLNGDNVILENCEVEHTVSAAGGGPGVQLDPTANNAHQGSSEPAPRCTNITVRFCTVHDTAGEAIYLGGGGFPINEAGAGYPSHSRLYITNNVIYNAGVWSGQGDGIDFKGGLDQLYISGNLITNIGTVAETVRGIVGQGQIPGTNATVVIERNRIGHCTHISDGAIVLANSWGVAAGVTIRNNIVDTITGGVGILLYETQNECAIYNNIIYGCSAEALRVDAGSTVNVRNNIFAANNGGGAQVDVSGTVNAWDYNAWTGALGYGPPGAHSIDLGVNADAVFINAAASDFRHKSTSPLLEVAVTIGSFSDDMVGTSRPQSSIWDIGAYERFASSPISSPPIVTTLAGKGRLSGKGILHR